MLVLIVLFATIILCIVAVHARSELIVGLGILVGILSAVTLFMAVLAIPAYRMEYASKIQEFKSVNETISAARERRFTESERAALFLKISDWNAWLKSMQYWNSSIWDIYVPDEVDDLKPIE